MQRYILIRLVQGFVTLIAISVIVFGLGRIAGNPLDVLLPMEATQEDYRPGGRAWGLDQPLHIQYFKFIGNALRGQFGDSLKWPGHSAMGLIKDRFPATCTWRDSPLEFLSFLQSH